MPYQLFETDISNGFEDGTLLATLSVRYGVERCFTSDNVHKISAGMHGTRKRGVLKIFNPAHMKKCVQRVCETIAVRMLRTSQRYMTVY